MLSALTGVRRPAAARVTTNTRVSALACLILVQSAAGGADWSTDASGQWTNPANWSAGKMPGPADDVVLDRPSADPVITYTYNQLNYQVRSLLVNEMLILRDSVPLGVATTTQLNNTIQLVHGTLKGGIVNAGPGGQILVPANDYGELSSVTLNAPVNVQPGGHLTLNGTWRNQGVITAANASVSFNGTFNTEDIGTFHFADSTVRVSGVMNNAGRTLALNASTGTWSLEGSSTSPGTIVGGTVAATGGMRLDIAACAALDGVCLQTDSLVYDGTELGIRNGLTLNNSTLTFLGGNGTSVWFSAAAPQTLGGTGQLVLNSNATNLVVQVGGHLTIGPGITIRGGGAVHPNGQTIVNQGTIAADNPNHSMVVHSTHGTFHNQGTIEVRPGGSMVLFVGGPGWSNTGLIRVAGGSMTLNGTFDQDSLGPFQYAGGSVLVEGTIANAGKTLALSANTGSWMLNNCTIDGGRVTATDGAQLLANPSSLYGLVSNNVLRGGVVLDAPLAIPAWSTMTVTDGLTVNRGITLAGTSSEKPAYLKFSGTQAVAGNGQIILEDGAYNYVQPTATLTLGPEFTIRTGTGGGTLGGTAAGVAIINQGTISAQTRGKSITLAGTCTNAGTFEARNGGKLVVANAGKLTNLSGSTLTGGCWNVYAHSALELHYGSITTNAATVLLSGPYSSFAAIDALAMNQGTFTITAGRDFAVMDFTNAGNLAVGTGSDFSASSFVQTSGGTLTVEIAGTGMEDFGQLAISGPTTLEGTLRILLAPGYQPRFGDVYPILASQSIVGAFGTVVQADSGYGRFEPLYTTSGLALRYVPEPGSAVLLALTALPILSSRRMHKR